MKFVACYGTPDASDFKDWQAVVASYVEENKGSIVGEFFDQRSRHSTSRGVFSKAVEVCTKEGATLLIARTASVAEISARPVHVPHVWLSLPATLLVGDRAAPNGSDEPSRMPVPAWEPPRTDGPLFFPPGAPALRRPRFFIKTFSVASMEPTVYFVNFSDEVLDEVTGSSGGFMTVDEDCIAAGSELDFVYKNVVPNEAVKIGTYHLIYDSDWSMTWYVRVKSPWLGTQDYATGTGRRAPNHPVG